MDPAHLLLVIYRLEEPLLQTGDWGRLRIPVLDLIETAGAPPGEVMQALVELRLKGDVVFLPDWKQDSGSLRQGQLVDSEHQWESILPQQGTHPAWQPRKVFLPENLKPWAVRSRVAETIRLLSFNRERFGLEPATAHVGYLRQERSRPDANLPVADVLRDLQHLASSGAFPRATRTDDLRLALEVVAGAFPYPRLTGFQARSWEAVLRALFGSPRPHDAVMLTAGVSSGKTFAFLLPLLTLLVYRRLGGEGGQVRVLALYPRTSLVVDQFHVLSEYLGRVNEGLARHGRPLLTDHPALDAAQLLGLSLGLEDPRERRHARRTAGRDIFPVARCLPPPPKSQDNAGCSVPAAGGLRCLSSTSPARRPPLPGGRRWASTRS
jgi:hypothetical protein